MRMPWFLPEPKRDAVLPDLRPGYLSLEHAAVWADVHPRTIKRWIAQGLQTYQAGPRTKVLIKPGDIDGFLTKQQATVPDLDAIVEDVLAGLK